MSSTPPLARTALLGRMLVLLVRPLVSPAPIALLASPLVLDVQLWELQRIVSALFAPSVSSVLPSTLLLAQRVRLVTLRLLRVGQRVLSALLVPM